MLPDSPGRRDDIQPAPDGMVPRPQDKDGKTSIPEKNDGFWGSETAPGAVFFHFGKPAKSGQIFYFEKMA